MTDGRVADIVSEERTELMADAESVPDAVLAKPTRGQTVALGLLALGEPTEAKRWFVALTEEWARQADAEFEWNYEGDDRKSAQAGPWRDYLLALYAGLFGGESLDDAARTVYERATAPFVDDLDRREHEPRIDYLRLLGGFLLGEGSVAASAEALEARVEETGGQYERRRFPPARAPSAESTAGTRPGSSTASATSSTSTRNTPSGAARSTRCPGPSRSTPRRCSSPRGARAST